jgi:hypothetical protein
LYGINISFSNNIEISFIFTIVAILRSYLIRRYFNNRIQEFTKSFDSNK